MQFSHIFQCERLDAINSCVIQSINLEMVFRMECQWFPKVIQKSASETKFNKNFKKSLNPTTCFLFFHNTHRWQFRPIYLNTPKLNQIKLTQGKCHQLYADIYLKCASDFFPN